MDTIPSDAVVLIARELPWWDRQVMRKVCRRIYHILGAAAQILGIIPASVYMWADEPRQCLTIVLHGSIDVLGDMDWHGIRRHDAREYDAINELAYSDLARLANWLVPRRLARELYLRGFYNNSVLNGAIIADNPAIFDTVVEVLRRDTGYAGMISACHLSLPLTKYIFARHTNIIVSGKRRPIASDRPMQSHVLQCIYTNAHVGCTPNLIFDTHQYVIALERYNCPVEAYIELAAIIKPIAPKQLQTIKSFTSRGILLDFRLDQLAFALDYDLFMEHYTHAGEPVLTLHEIHSHYYGYVYDIRVLEYLLYNGKIANVVDACVFMAYHCDNPGLARFLLEQVPDLAARMSVAGPSTMWYSRRAVCAFREVDPTLLLRGARPCTYIEAECHGADMLMLWCYGETTWHGACIRCIEDVIIARPERHAALYLMPSTVDCFNDMRWNRRLRFLKFENLWNRWELPDNMTREVIQYLVTEERVPRLHIYAYERIQQVIAIIAGYESVHTTVNNPLFAAYADACAVVGLPTDLYHWRLAQLYRDIAQ